MLDPAYRLLARVEFIPDLTLNTPAGGRVRITHIRYPEDGSQLLNALRINCDREETLWELLRLSTDLGLIGGFRGLKKLHSPLMQSVVVDIDDRDLLLWQPQRLPKVLSLRGAMRWLARR